MSFSLNVVHLAGNLTSDPEKRDLPGGPVVSFSIAINRQWKGKDGTKQEEVTFVDCTAWSRTADFIAKFFKKGRPIYVEGRLKLDQWDDKGSGAKRSKLIVTVDNAQFTSSPDKGEADPFA